MSSSEVGPQPPAMLRRLASWQAGRISTLGARLTAARMPLEARTDFAVLAALTEAGALSQADIGRRLGLDRNNVHGVVTRLEREHWVERHADPNDRRRNVVDLTAAGRRHLRELHKHANEVQNELLAALDDNERDTLHALLDKVLNSHPTQPA